MYNIQQRSIHFIKSVSGVSPRNYTYGVDFSDKKKDYSDN